MTARVLILWNQVEADVYEQMRADGPRAVEGDPTREASQVETVAEELDAIADAMRGAGKQVAIVNIRDDLGTILAALDEHRPDAVMNLVDFFGDDPAHEAHVPAIFELLGVPYTGARPAALARCQHKHRAKALIAQAGLPTAPYLVVSGRVGDDRVPRGHPLRFPVIVKPALEDASVGIDLGAVVDDLEALDARVEQALGRHRMPVIIEEYIDGREIHCAVLGNDPPEALPLFEMEFVDRVDADGKDLPKIITFRAKWDPTSKDFYAMDSRCPAEGLEPEVVAHIQDTALRAYRVMGCRDYARVDMRLDAATGEPFILEVNPNPDLADGGAFMQCAVASGRTFAGTINTIADLAIARAPQAQVRTSRDPMLQDYLARKREHSRTGA
jgi:D-alanine-D-alanine ligase